MPRIRSIHPKMWHDDRFMALSAPAQVLLLRLGCVTDYADRFLTEKAERECAPLWDAAAFAEIFAAGLIKADGEMSVLDFGFGFSRRRVSRWEVLRSQVFERDGWRCVYCGSGENLHCDHVIPASRGGSSEIGNLATACRPCNLSKHDLTPEEWRARA